MFFTSLSDRLDELPLVLAGPILRRVEHDSVSVWIVLKESRLLTLRVYDDSNQELMTGTRNTVSLGQYLHMVVLTATPCNVSQPLVPNRTYHYTVQADGLDIMDMASLGYGGLLYPSFALPPSDLNNLRIVHASCRKMHAQGHDAFVALDSMIEAEAATPATFALQRPHQLFLTGDQIYADDVDGILLYLLQDAASALLGWHERLADGLERPASLLEQTTAIAIGNRGDMINRDTGFKFPAGDEDAAACHLLYLSEYYMMYMFMWSPELWPPGFNEEAYPVQFKIYAGFATNLQVTPEEYGDLLTTVIQFQRSVARVRVALANVPTYMICDDHEITDDWYLNMGWCKDVLRSPLGTRIVQNGLTAYALFQAWGNTPAQFAENAAQPGTQLLKLLPRWSEGTYLYEAADAVTPLGTYPSPTTYRQSMYNLLGMPDPVRTAAAAEMIANSAFRLHYNYHIAWPLHEVFVLDTRTERAFPGGDNDYPVLISPAGLQRQFPAFSPTAELTFIVAATPVSGVPRIEWQLGLVSLFSKYYADAEGYSGQPLAVESLYSTIAARAQAKQQQLNLTTPARVVVLSGDVHYGFTNRLEFWGTRLYGNSDLSAQLPTQAHFVMAQLCASALKNEKFGSVAGTESAHQDGYRYFLAGAPTARIMGWTTPPTASGNKIVMTLAAGGRTYSDGVSNEKPTLDVSELDAGSNVQLVVQPDWAYRIDYLSAVGGSTRPGSGPEANPQDPATAPAGSELKSYIDAAINSQKYARHDGYGREIVGRNNIGEVRCVWGATEATKFIRHQLWWRLKSFDASLEEGDNPDGVTGPNAVELPPFPLSVYDVPMGQNAQKYPKPSL